MFSGGKIGFWMVSEFHLSIFFPKLAESTDTLGIIGTLTIVSLLIYKYDFLKIDLRERKGGRKREGEGEGGRERDRQTLIWERNIDRLPPRHTPKGESNQKPGYVPWPKSNPPPFSVRDDAPTKWAKPARATNMILVHLSLNLSLSILCFLMVFYLEIT